MQSVKNTKVYVEVLSVTTPEGRMIPRALVWEDGTRYKIDRVTDVKQAPAIKAGGQGDRYTIWIDGKQSYLFFERNGSSSGDSIGRWFVERRSA